MVNLYISNNIKKYIHTKNLSYVTNHDSQVTNS